MWSLRAVLGALLLLAPRRVVSDLPHGAIDRRALVFARVLGLRQIAQAAVLRRHHSAAWMRAGAAVDATHAATMVALALTHPARRRLALTNAAVAGALAAEELGMARGQRTGGLPAP